jgi:glycosyltransferase involved in cell wall biosynthesis
MSTLLQQPASVLLATYNGERFLEPLLQSLATQTDGNYRLLIRDDGSNDGTGAILERAQAMDSRITVINDGHGSSGSARANFGHLLNQIPDDTGPILFCDQDDVWEPAKIATLRGALVAAETVYGSDIPLLAHCDLMVTDGGLDTLAASFWAYQFIDPQLGRTLNRLLVQNSVTGCAMAFNQPLLRLARPIPDAAVMHDWWLALVASAFGHIEVVPKPLVRYRQHGTNDTGATRWDLRHIANKALRFMNRDALLASLNRGRHQAAAFEQAFGHQLSPAHLATVRAFIATATVRPWTKRQLLWRHRLLKTGLVRNLGLFLRI